MIQSRSMSRTGQSRRPIPYRLRLERLEERVLLATFIVDSTADTADFSPGDGICSTAASGGVCTLRAAIEETEALANVGGPDEIHFNIGGIGVHTIQPASALPTITQPLIIDGYTQPGTAMNTDPDGFNGTLLIELNGANAGAADGLRIDASNSIVRGLVINGFLRTGTPTTNGQGIELHGSSNRIEGNLIGTDASGTTAVTNEGIGIDIDGASGDNHTIGGTTPAARNIISGNTFTGIRVAERSGIIIQGNFIGTQRDGTSPLGNGNNGVGYEFNVTIGSGNQIGGTTPGSGNVIAHNGGIGVRLQEGMTQTSILGNSIFSNGALGIDLNPLGGSVTGVNPNDLGDTDGGANNLQNFPIITGISHSGGMTTIQGKLNSVANTLFRVELFDNVTGDPSGYGEGQFFLGAVPGGVTTDPTGNATFSATFATPAGGNFISATATDPNNNTSEFGCSLVVSTTADSGLGSLRSAITCANENPGPDTITVPAGVYTLTITGSGEDAAATGDLDITEDLIINGAGAATTIIQACDSSAGPCTGIDRVFDIVPSDISVSISGVTIRNGSITTASLIVPEGGGGIRNAGLLTLSDSVVTQNQALGTGRADGGGIFVTTSARGVKPIGTLSLIRSSVSGNTADFDGGGIFLDTDGIPSAMSPNLPMTFTDCAILNNIAGLGGGGINNSGNHVPLTLIRCDVSQNMASGFGEGGGIEHGPVSGDLTLTDTTIMNNSAHGGGGIASFGGALTLTNTRVENNTAVDFGGGIQHAPGEGDVTLTDSTLNNNTAGKAGGGIENGAGTGALRFTRSSVSGNHAGTDGGGIENGAGTGDISLIDSTVSNNISGREGGGIDNVAGNSALTLTNSMVDNNSAARDGGGILHAPGIGDVTITNSSISGNTASGEGAGLALEHGEGAVTITDSTISGNRITGDGDDNGAGIVNVSGAGSTTITRSTISGNQIVAPNGDGGGIFQLGPLIITNSTLSGNTATNRGGGLFQFSQNATLLNVTIDLNGAGQGGGIFAESQGTVSLKNTIIAGSTTGGNFGGTLTAFSSQGNNLSSDNTGALFLTMTGPSADSNNTDPLLGPLQDNGGPTLTHLPLGGPAVDAGNNTGAPATDQRGVARPQPPGGTVDIGAVEVAPVSCSLIVDTTSDADDSADGVTSLREAIICANSTPGADTISVPAGTYTLTIAGTGENAAATGDLDITEDLTITGAGAATTIIQACDSSAAPCSGIDRVFHILTGGSAPTNVNISGVTIRNGSANSGAGIEIVDAGTVQISSTTITGNTADFDGGGISTLDSTLVIMTSTIGGNHASLGGGIAAVGGSVTLVNSTVNANTASNDGGGIAIEDVVLTITESTISNNTSEGQGGGIMMDSGSTDLVRSTVSGNSAERGGGLHNFGTMIITDSTISGNSAQSEGGGIVNLGDSLTIDRTTINGNTAGGTGGGIDNEAPLTITHSTISGNMASSDGGGISNQSNAMLTIINSTISGNTAVDTEGGGIFFGSGALRLTNVTIAFNTANAGEGGGVQEFGDDSAATGTIIAQNTGGDCAGNGITNTSNHNLDSDGTCFFAPGTPGGVGNLTANPQLAPLADNGGPTQTHALCTAAAAPDPACTGGSPAIDAGDDSVLNPPLSLMTDQRGTGFPRQVGTHVDIGAVEAGIAACSLVVTTTADTDNASDLENSLREAINCANSNPDSNTITFNIAGTGVKTIDVGSGELGALPPFTAPVVIDGTGANGCSGGPQIELNGSAAGAAADGLHLSGGNSIVRGLIISRFDGNGILIDTAGGNLIECTFVGTNAAGDAASPNGDDGIEIFDVPNNTIGSSVTGAGNLISGNGGDGIYLALPGATGNRILGNTIGTNLAGTSTIPNGDDGVDLDSAPGNTIGAVRSNPTGACNAACNLISGNDDDGVEFDGGEDLTGAGDASGNLVVGNFIGTNRAGSAAIGNGDDGVTIESASNNTIGGSAPGARNLVSGNNSFGVSLSGNGATGNVVQGNYIGTNATGTAALGNLDNGIDISSPDNTIGGTAAGAGNVISANTGNGIFIHEGADRTLVQGNRIGTNPAGNAIVPGAGQTDQSNTGAGIILFSSNNTVGGTASGARNIIAGSSGDAIDIGLATGNVIQGNSIGTDATGTLNLRNPGGAGVRVDAGTNNTIGGTSAGEANLIAFNFLGVQITNIGDPSTGNAVLANSIFSNTPGIGIDLERLAPNTFGPTPNDPNDPDSGPNNLQNFPEFASATLDIISGMLTVTYNVPSDPANSAYPLRVEFYKADADGQEGQTFIGFDTFTAADFAAGTRSATFTPLAPVGIGNLLLATATDSVASRLANTSEFSGAIQVAGGEGAADLQLLKSDSPDPVSVGEDLTYTIQVTNNGPDDATNVVVRDQLPANVQFVSAQATTGSCSSVGNFVTCNLGSIPADGNNTRLITIVVQPLAAGTQLTNTATAVADQIDPVPDNESNTITTTVREEGGAEGQCTVNDLGSHEGSGNVTAKVSQGKLLIRGDGQKNNLLIEAGRRRGSLRISGRDDTTVNGGTHSVEVRDFVDVSIAMGAGSDVVAIVDALLENGLRVKMQAQDDDLILCGVEVQGRARTGEGRGRDNVSVDDSTFHDDTHLGTGRGADDVQIERNGKKNGPRTEFKKRLKIRTEEGNDKIKIGRDERGNSVDADGCTKVRGGEGHDIFDANLGSDTNEFKCGPKLKSIEEAK